MARSEYFGVTLFAIIMAVSIEQASAIKCWRCSSDVGDLCKDPFNDGVISEHQKRWSFVDCMLPSFGENYTAVCKKIKQLVHEKEVISRSCFWEHIDAHKNDCLNSNTPSYIKTEFCETCSTDGCNAAVQYGPIALLVAIPVAVTKIFLL